jgi:hypothetical protein
MIRILTLVLAAAALSLSSCASMKKSDCATCCASKGKDKACCADAKAKGTTCTACDSKKKQ